jgi:hypothetical protein
VAAIAATLTFATLPTFWRWSTEAKIYTLNMLLFSAVLYTLASLLDTKKNLSSIHHSPFIIHHSPFFWLGLQVAVHSTTVLLIPGLLLFVWLNRGQRSGLVPHSSFIIHHSPFTTLLLHAASFLLPGLLYLYVPLRAEGLIATYGRQVAIERGLLADFYHSGFVGLVRYFAAADFTGGVVTNWGLVPGQLVSVYGQRLLVDEVTSLGVVLGVIGGIGLAVARPRIFWPLFLIYAIPIPFVLAYGQGEQSAFLLPSFLIFALFIGHTLTLGEWASRRISPPLPCSPAPLLLFLALLAGLLVPQIRYNLNWLDAKWSRAIYDEWADALEHPLEPGAALVAHWGDLTSFWYMQQAEGRRPDLRGLYPPTEASVQAWQAQNGGALYIAGPLQGWAEGIQDRYRLIPWGRLVRLAPREADPRALLPPLPHTSEAIFDQKLRLIGADYAPQAAAGGTYGVTLGWQTLAELPPETTISLRLSRGEAIVAQLDDTLLSGWFPADTLPAGQYGVSYMPIPIPVGTLPGKYRLQLVTYLSYKHPWPLADGGTLLDLGEVALTLPPPDYQPDLSQYTTLPGHDWGGELELAGYSYTVVRVEQGKGFGVECLWRAQSKPSGEYTLLAELVDAAGNVVRSIQHRPAGGLSPTTEWQPGQLVRDQVDLVLPASAPVGPEALQVWLSWLRPDGSRLPVRRWGLPAGESLSLGWIAVTEKEGRLFEPPAIEYRVGANLANKARLLGYNNPDGKLETGIKSSELEGCAGDAAGCQISFDFYWQGISEMDQLYFVFVHLVDEQGQIVAQHDRGPGIRGKQPTTSWLPGEVVTDPVTLSLPADLAPGRYTLWVGLYLPPTGPRLLVLDEAGQAAGDFVEVGAVEVKVPPGGQER